MLVQTFFHPSCTLPGYIILAELILHWLPVAIWFQWLWVSKRVALVTQSKWYVHSCQFITKCQRIIAVLASSEERSGAAQGRVSFLTFKSPRASLVIKLPLNSVPVIYWIKDSFKSFVTKTELFQRSSLIKSFIHAISKQVQEGRKSSKFSLREKKESYFLSLDNLRARWLLQSSRWTQCTSLSAC